MTKIPDKPECAFKFYIFTLLRGFELLSLKSRVPTRNVQMGQTNLGLHFVRVSKQKLKYKRRIINSEFQQISSESFPYIFNTFFLTIPKTMTATVT